MSIFSDVLVRKPGRSLFNLKHERKFSADFGYLYPILCMEAVPGDTFKLSTEYLVRTAPLTAPVMHRINVKINYFFVPNRLLWDEWKDFITGINQQATYDPTSDDQSNYFVHPVPPFYELTSDSSSDVQALFKDGSLADFLGFPTMRPTESVDSTVNVQTLPFQAYLKIYNDWYRNQNVEAEHWISKSSGKQNSSYASIPNIFQLRKRMYEKDYFTSALPFAQRGDAVKLPIAEIRYNKNGTTKLKDEDGNLFLASNDLRNALYSTNDHGSPVIATKDANNAIVQPTNIDNSSNLTVEAGTINDLRIATRLQRWLEINARVGGRYIEQILGHFGVRSSDARLDRSEYLGGYSSPLLISEVEQNSATDVNSTPQGNLAGKASSYGNSNSVKCFCEEHGFIIGLMSIIPRTAYQDGLPKMFQRNFKEDYYWPEFANLGEQDVNKAEVYFKLSDGSNQSFDRFGFQERYVEYKYIPSTVHGEFKNNLQFWHLGRSFPSQPALTKDFVTCSPRNNIFAVENGANHFYINLINSVTALRPMPKQAIPTL